MSAIRTSSMGAAILLVACSSPPPAPPPPGPPLAPAVSTEEADRPAVPGAAPAVEATIAVEPDGPCEPVAATAGLLVDSSGASVPPLSRIVLIGPRWVAGGPEMGGLLTFAGDLGDVTPVVSGSDDLVVGGPAIHVFDATSAEVGHRVLDDRGVETTGRRVVAPLSAPAPPAFAVASGPAGGVAAWTEGSRIRAIGFDGAGTPGAPLDVPGDASALVAAAADDGRLALVWNGSFEGGAALYGAVGTKAGFVDPPVPIVRTVVPRELQRLVPTASGFVLLLAGQEHVEVLPLDAKSAFRPPLVQYAGMRAGWDLVSRGDRILVAATKSDRTPVVRLLDERGRPRSPWRCLSSQSGEPVGVARTPTGYGVTFRDPSDRQRFVLLDESAR